MQLNQANAVSCALDWFRSLAPHTSGAVVWQLNDCWPVTSWAAIDGDGREKPLWFALRNAFAPRVVTVQPAGDGLRAVLGNDTDDAWEGEVVLTRRGFDGTVLATARMPAAVAARSSQLARRAARRRPASSTRRASWSWPRASAPGGCGSRPSPGTASCGHPPRGRGRGRRAGRPGGEGVTEVTVTARCCCATSRCSSTRRTPAPASTRGLVTLLPGESTTFRVRGVHGIPAERWRDPGVLRSANQLVTPLRTGRE